MDGETQAAVEGEVISPQIYADERRSGNWPRINAKERECFLVIPCFQAIVQTMVLA
jgi:hypothetical protein